MMQKKYCLLKSMESLAMIRMLSAQSVALYNPNFLLYPIRLLFLENLHSSIYRIYKKAKFYHLFPYLINNNYQYTEVHIFLVISLSIFMYYQRKLEVAIWYYCTQIQYLWGNFDYLFLLEVYYEWMAYFNQLSSYLR